jgi:predicted nucleic acid-binding protein
MTKAVHADTSLLASLYLADANTGLAVAMVARTAQPLMLCAWQEFELENVRQMRLFRREVSRSDLSRAEAQLADDVAAGAVVNVSTPLGTVLAEARRIAGLHTAALGVRAFDVFHVAMARCLRAETFLTLDLRQRSLAQRVGLMSP